MWRYRCSWFMPDIDGTPWRCISLESVNSGQVLLFVVYWIVVVCPAWRDSMHRLTIDFDHCLPNRLIITRDDENKLKRAGKLCSKSPFFFEDIDLFRKVGIRNEIRYIERTNTNGKPKQKVWITWSNVLKYTCMKSHKSILICHAY